MANRSFSALAQIDREIDRFIGDDIYEQEPVYAAVENHSTGARVIAPPRKDVVLSSKGATSTTQRDQHLLEIQREGRFQWKRTLGYYAQSHAENAFSRYKRTFGGHLRAKRKEAQTREASLGWVAQSPTRIGLCGIISSQLKEMFKRSFRLLFDRCNRVVSSQFSRTNATCQYGL